MRSGEVVRLDAVSVEFPIPHNLTSARPPYLLLFVLPLTNHGSAEEYLENNYKALPFNPKYYGKNVIFNVTKLFTVL